MPFLTDLTIRDVTGGKYWELTEPLIYRTRSGELIRVPAGYRSDLVSVPRVAWRVVSPSTPAARRAAVLHDYIYTDLTGRYSRAEADLIFYQALREDGTGGVKARLMFRAVRLFGRGGW